MCCTACSSRKAYTRSKYTYTRETSPWNKKIFISIRAIQLFVSIGVSILGAGFYKKKEHDYRYDDGISNAWYLVICAMTWGMTISGLGYTYLIVHWWRKNELHPGWVVAIDSCMSFLWVAMVAMVLATFGTNYSSIWDYAEAVELLCMLASIPYFVGLVYSGIVYHRFRKARDGRDIEIASLDDRSHLAKSQDIPR